MEYFEKLKWRYATKLFDENKTVPVEKLEQLLDGIQLAASSYGLQPYRILVIKDPELRKELRKVAWDQPQITTASYLLVFAADVNTNAESVDAFTRLIAQKRNLPEDSLEAYGKVMKDSLKKMEQDHLEGWVTRQAYLALGFGLVTAAQLGIDACPMEGFIPEEFDRILGLHEKGLRSKALMTVGYRSADDKYQHLPKVRKDKEDLFIRI